MDKLDRYRAFVKVAEMGSFVKASLALGMPRASVSAAIAQLETDTGTRLLHRTTRQVQLTPDGQRLLQRVVGLLDEARQIDRLFKDGDEQVRGTLKVNLPSRIARRMLAPALPAFLRSYPHMRLQVGSTDRPIDLVQEGVDCAVRIGMLSDSSLVVRPLGRIALINCAGPAYLQQRAVPRHPDELRTHGHVAVGYVASASGREAPWEYLENGQRSEFVLPSLVAVDNAESYIAACQAGVGLIQIPRFDVQHLLDRGLLVEILPDHRPRPLDVSMVYPHRRQRSRRLQAFIDWFEDLIEPHLES